MNIIWYNDKSNDPDIANKKFKEKTKQYAYMNCVGCPQPSYEEFESLFELIKNKHKSEENKIVVFDLREETHIFFDGNPRQTEETKTEDEIAGEYNKEKNKLYMYSEEEMPDDDDEDNSQLKSVSSESSMESYPSPKTPTHTGYHHGLLFSSRETQKENGFIPYEEIKTEQQIVDELGGHSIRIRNKNGATPTPDNVDQFLSFAIQAAKTRQPIIIHCHGGNSRTAMYVAMYETLYFALNPEAENLKKNTRDLKDDPQKHKKLQEPDKKDKKYKGNEKKFEKSFIKFEARQLFLESFRSYIQEVFNNIGSASSSTEEKILTYSDWLKLRKDKKHPSN